MIKSILKILLICFSIMLFFSCDAEDIIEIITGQGTVGKEITEQIKALNIVPDMYLCCVGGGGLIAGSSFYLKSNFPEIKSYSVEPENFNDTLLSGLIFSIHRAIANRIAPACTDTPPPFTIIEISEESLSHTMFKG